MNEKPLERLNYYNGQRLQATDFRLEQEYHMRVRRWLNRSLYGPGIADGLTVTKVAGAPKIRISPGLALDAQGREIILLEEREEIVQGNHANNELYLTIRYNEEILARQDMTCSLVKDTKEKIAWGGPARVLTETLIEWNDKLPHEGSGKVLLARVTLGANCTVVDVLDTSVRDYIGEGSASRVKQYALEGFRDVDQDNAGVIRFHIRGRQPSSVTLFLRGEKFPSYFYTELGRHNHGFTPSEGVTLDASPNTVSSVGSGHTHSFTGRTVNGTHNDNQRAITLSPYNIHIPIIDVDISVGPWGDHTKENILNEIDGSISGGSHQHSHSHTHRFTAPGQIDNFGADINAESDNDSLDYLDSLQLSLKVGSIVISLTTMILTQLKNLSPEWENTTLGDGTAGHIFVAKGTPGIRLDLLPDVSIGEGEYEIVLYSNGPRNGGRIYYNLYVE